MMRNILWQKQEYTGVESVEDIKEFVYKEYKSGFGGAAEGKLHFAKHLPIKCIIKAGKPSVKRKEKLLIKDKAG